MRSHRAAAALVAVAAVAALLTGCSGSPSGNDALAVKVLQYRSDFAPRQLQLQVENRGADPVQVTSATFSSDFFDGPVSSKSAPSGVIAGSATDFPVVLPAARCGDGPANARVVVRWTSKSGSGTLSATPSDPVGSLKVVHSQDCSKAAFEKVATITPAEHLRFVDDNGKPIALLDLTIVPTGAPGTVTLISTQDTTLIAQREGQLRTVNLAFTAASPVTVITLDYTPSRCEQHVVAEDKVGTLIPIHADAGTFTDAQFQVAVSQAVKFEFYDWFARYCDW